METLKRTLFTGALLFCCSVPSIQAAKVSLTSDINFVTLGEKFSLDLVINFSDLATLGGNGIHLRKRAIHLTKHRNFKKTA